jgi:hypothetical protein
MSAESVTADVVVVTDTGAVPNTGPPNIMGDGPMFVQKRTAATVPKGSGETPAVASASDEPPAPTTMENLAKKSLGGDACKPENNHNRKLPVLAGNIGAVFTAVMTLLKAYDIVSVVESKRTDWFRVEQQMSVAKWLATLRPFNCMTKLIEENAEFTAPNIAPFHIIAVVCLVKGNNPSFKRIATVMETIDDTKSHALKVSNGHSEVANMVLTHVYTNHAKMAHSIYCSLVQISDSDGLCKERASIIMDWINRLKPKVSSYYEILMKERMAKNMQTALLLQLRKGKAVPHVETETDEDANLYDD